MKELRCPKCNKLLLKYEYFAIIEQGEIVVETSCPRCKERVTIKFD